MLNGKVVLVTDAACPSGIAVAECFAREGALLALNYPGGAPEASQAAFLGSANPADRLEVEALVEAVMAEFGGIDILIHNSRAVPRRTLVDCTDEEFQAVMDISAKSAFLFTQAVGRVMKAAGGGKIVYLSSIHAEKPTGANFPYSLAAGAVKMLAREAALDLGIYGVNANFIEWGPVAGDEALFRDRKVSILYENLAERIPGKAVGTWTDLAELALFFASENCRFVNGADLRADGGFLLSYIPRYSYEELEKISEGAGV